MLRSRRRRRLEARTSPLQHPFSKPSQFPDSLLPPDGRPRRPPKGNRLRTLALPSSQRCERSASFTPLGAPRRRVFPVPRRLFPVLREFTGKNVVCAHRDISQVIAIEAVCRWLPWSRNREKIPGNREAKTLQQGRNRDDTSLPRPLPDHLSKSHIDKQVLIC